MTLVVRSLQTRLALRLAVVFLVATALGIGALLHEGMQTADRLSDLELTRRAGELAHSVMRGPDRLELSTRLEEVYSSPAMTEAFAVRKLDRQMLAASGAEFAAVVGEWPAAGADPRYFRLEGFGPTGQDYYGLTIRQDSAAGPLSVTVARASDADALAEALLKEFALKIAWVIPLFAATTLLVAIWSIRQGLRPVLAVSERAAAIGPDAIGVRLPKDGLPTELMPLVSAVNRALDRLENGFVMQRRFTANAAHELRTPLAILTAGLDELPGSPQVGKLRSDAARMNRLVEQLLRVARLDAVPIDVDAAVDLHAVAAQSVAYLAPWVIAHNRRIGFDAPDGPVWVRGNADAIADALRNLIENAVSHTPPRTEVTVSVSPDGTATVADHGGGIPIEDRPHIFERFWRGRGSKGEGAGLGLAIVAEIARAHGGEIEVANTPAGGANFSLRFRAAEPNAPSAVGTVAPYGTISRDSACSSGGRI